MGGMVPGSAGSVPWFQTVLDEELLRYLVYLECVCVRDARKGYGPGHGGPAEQMTPGR